MSETLTRLVLFARYPAAGQAKTRLIPAIGPSRAAEVHRKLAERTSALLARHGYPFEVHFTGANVEDFQNWLSFRAKYVQQPEGDLSARLAAALEPAPVIFFGSDTPDLEIDHVDKAIEGLEGHDIVIGPAMDGGYYLIGMKKPYCFLLDNMPWSTGFVLEETMRRASDKALSVKLLEPLYDCDRPEDLQRWPWLLE